MEQINSSDLKTILHSKRANLYFLEHCRVLVNGGRVEYVTDAGKQSLYWNIPIANTTCVLLGTGTSITQAAVRELSKAGVMIGFASGGGSPLFAATEVEENTAWLSPQSEYRPTEYLQKWVRLWFDAEKRLQAAKAMQSLRLTQLEEQWLHNKHFGESGFSVEQVTLQPLLASSRSNVEVAASANDLLTEEARLTKALYRIACNKTNYGEFTRAKRGESIDAANQFLDHGNYLAYGLGATALWVLGIPHGLAVLHGKTRRGGLVFDAADLIKDALILPQAFISATRGHTEQEFRQQCIQSFARTEALDFIIESLQSISAQFGSETA